MGRLLLLALLLLFLLPLGTAYSRCSRRLSRCSSSSCSRIFAGIRVCRRLSFRAIVEPRVSRACTQHVPHAPQDEADDVLPACQARRRHGHGDAEQRAPGPVLVARVPGGACHETSRQGRCLRGWEGRGGEGRGGAGAATLPTPPSPFLRYDITISWYRDNRYCLPSHSRKTSPGRSNDNAICI